MNPENSKSVLSMVCKEEIYMWFKESTSSQRIDLLCGLLHLCLPLELRFLGTCLEDLARKDYAALRDYEVKANKLSEYSAVQSIVTSDGSLENRLNIYMSLLHSTNVVCANSLFHILLQIFESVKNIFSNESMCDDVRTVPLICQCEVSENLLLLFTLAAYHPAFVFSQRLRLFEILSKVVQIIKCNSCDKVVPNAGLTVDLSASRNVCTESSHTPDVELQLLGKIWNKVYVTSIELKQKTQNSDGYHIKVLFSSNEVAEVLKTYNQLKDFYTQLDSSLSSIATKLECHNEAVVLPKFSTCELPQNNKQVTDSLKSYFRDFMKLPSNISHNPEVTRLFRDFLNLPSTDSHEDSLKSSVEPAQQSSIEPSTTEDVDQLEQLSNGRSFEEESPPTVTRDSPRATSCTGNTRIRKSSSCLCDQPTVVASPSKSLPLLASLQNQRSRQTSPRSEGNDVAAWLKDIRLHKYTDSLAKYSWNQLLCLSDEELQHEGLTDGARKKFMTEIHLMRSGQKPGVESSPGRSSQSQIWRTSCRSPNVKSSIPISGSDSPVGGGSPHLEFFFPESNDAQEKGPRQLLGCKQQQRIANDCDTIDSTKSTAAGISSAPQNRLLAFVTPDCTMSHQVTTVASSPCILPAQTLPTAMHYPMVDQKLPSASCLSSRWPRPAKSISASIISGGPARPFYNMYSSTVPFQNESQNSEYKFAKLASDSTRGSPFAGLGINAVIENETSAKSSLTSLSSSTLVNSVRSASLTSATCQTSPSISCAFDVPPPLPTLPVCSSQNGGLFPYNSTSFTANSNASNCLNFIPDNLQKASVSTSTMPLVDSRPVDVALLSSLPYPPAFYAFPPPSIPGAVPVIPSLPFCTVTQPPIQPANVTADTLHHPTEYLPPPPIPPCCQQPPPATGQGLYNPFPWSGQLFTTVPTTPCFNIAGNLVPPPPYDVPPPPLPLQPRLPAHCPAPYRLVADNSQEVQYQTTYTITVSGPRQPTISVPPPGIPTSLSSNAADLQPPYPSHSGNDTSSSTVPSCANCGKFGHQHLECTEGSADNTTMNTAQFRLNLSPKAESI